MKSKTILALTVAGTFAFSGAVFAGGVHRSSVEVQTPSSVDESAPWLTGRPHLGGWTSQDRMSGTNNEQSSDSIGVGASSAMNGSGSGGYDSATSSASDMAS